jgi:hypothetical protein
MSCYMLASIIGYISEGESRGLCCAQAVREGDDSMIPYAEDFLSPKLDIILENTLINVIEIASSRSKNI